MVAFLKRLLGRQQKATVEPMHGAGFSQTEAEQDVTRKNMESELASQRERRDERAAGDPGSEPPPTT